MAANGKNDANNEQNTNGDPLQESTREKYRSYKRKAREKRGLAEKGIDKLAGFLGTMVFLIVNVVFFTGWITINLGYVSGVNIFDPFPFNLLTLIVSLEAIILTILVLMSQNREVKVSTLREEIDTQVDIAAEEEITKVLEILKKIARKQGIDLSKDRKLKKMLKPVDKHYLEKKYEEED